MKPLSSSLLPWYERQSRAYNRRASRKARRRSRYNLRGNLEPLEDRRLLTVFTVPWASTPEDRGAALRAAVESANDYLGRDEIRFAPEYNSAGEGPNVILLKRTGAGSASNEILIRESVKIIGWGADKILISGNRDGSNDANEATRLFWIEYSGAPGISQQETLIEGMTLANGYAITESDQESGRNTADRVGIGGAIAALESLHLNGVVLKNNFAESSGGAVSGQMIGSSHVLKIENSIFEGNTADQGGGVYYYGGDIGDNFEIIDSQFIANVARAGNGGAILAGEVGQVAQFRMTGTLIDGNRAVNGGGVYVNARSEGISDDDAFYISQSLFCGNTATNNNATEGTGGGLFLLHSSASPFTIVDTTFEGNYARKVGAGAFVSASDFNLDTGDGPVRVEIIDSTISGNGFSQDSVNPAEATEKGGGLAIDAGFVSESSGDDFVRLTNVTVTNNQAKKQISQSSGGGAGFWVSDTGFIPGSTILHNSIVSANTAISLNMSGNVVVDQDNILGDVLDSVASKYNFVGTGYANLSNTTNIRGNDDPKLNSLGGYGGAVQVWGRVIPTHLPRYDSLVIDQGDPISAGLPQYDQRGAGFKRVMNGRRGLNGTLRVDMGAVERGVITVTTTVDDNNVNPATLSLREALAEAATDSTSDTIAFAESLYASGVAIIAVGSAGDLIVNSEVSIEGPGADKVIVQRTLGTAGRLFQVSSGLPGNGAKISGLKMTGGNGVSQGGAVTTSSALNLESVVVAGNSATSGGGIYVASTGSLKLIDSTIDNNLATGSLSQGGGIRMALGSGPRLEISGSTISNNTAFGGGGLDFTRIGSGQATGKIVNSTFSNNHAYYGGGLEIYGAARLELVNNTIAYNDANQGGGVYVSSGGASALLHNNIVAENIATSSSGLNANIFGTVDTLNSSHNLVVKSSNGAGVGGLVNSNLGNIVLTFGASAGLVATPGANGGQAKTIALTPTSNAIDHGNSTIAGSYGLVTDQRGFERFVDDTASDGIGGFVDIGAFEFRAPLLVSTLIDEFDNIQDFGDLSLREALAIASSIPGDDTIEFDFHACVGSAVLSLQDQTGDLVADQLVVDSNVVIHGPGATKLAISGGDETRVFFVSGSQVLLSGLTVRDGNTSSGGGGIDSTGNLTLQSVVVTGNTAANGGGIRIGQSGSLKIFQSSVDHNMATGSGGSAGGGIQVVAGSGERLEVRDSTIYENSAFVGGGIDFYRSASGLATGKIVNSTLAFNQGNLGGGINIYGPARLDLVNATIVYNTGAYQGGGLHLGGAGASALLHNSIIVNNNSSSSNVDIYGTVDSLSSHNMVMRTSGNATPGGLSASINVVLNFGSATGLGNLQDNGGPTKTVALDATSLAIDAGDNTRAEAFDLAFDQRGGTGFLRFHDWDCDDAEPIVDIGAYELAVDAWGVPSC